jgi:hypothetical protein
MNRNEFTSSVIDSTFQEILELNKRKGHDYAGDDDALSNFKETGKRKGIKPEQVLGVHLDKHLSAIDTYIREGQVESEPIEGRIDDAILYLLLLKGLVMEASHDGMDGH